MGFVDSVIAGIVAVVIISLCGYVVNIIKKFVVVQKPNTTTISIPNSTVYVLNKTEEKRNKEKEYKDLIDDLKKAGETVIIINHKIEKSNIFSSGESLTLKDANRIIKILNSIDEYQNISIIISTPGGCLTAAEIITDALINHKAKKTFYIPRYAFSAGTIIALAGNRICLGRGAVMGQVDPQMGTFGPSNSIMEYVNRHVPEKGAQSYSIFDSIMLLLFDQAEKSVNRVKNITQKACFSNNYTMENYNRLEEFLISGKSNHDTPLFYNDLKEFIPQLEFGLPENINRLVELSEDLVGEPKPNFICSLLGL